MTEPARTPCCIVGCKRSFKRLPHEDDDSETMCGKHYRCAPELVGRRRHTLKRFRRIERAVERLHRQVTRQGCASSTQEALSRRLRSLAHTASRLDRIAWHAIKIEAQRQQDAGFFAPKPRRRAVIREDRTTDPLASRFEDQFQRLKRAQVRA